MKAIALISGGLDSLLAAKLIQREGIEVIPLNFKIPFYHKDKGFFCGYNHRSNIVKKTLDSELRSIDLDNDFLEMIKNPRYGFGANMNPCIDCKILMLRKAKELMEPWSAAFIVTGEVLGQRPMSQHKQALSNIVEKAGLKDLVLRPLSARLLPETKPEREGWVIRKNLLNFSGRTRKPQIALAENLGIKDYPNPAGGCLLTDRQFAERLKDIINFGDLNLDDIELLKIGRHFRFCRNAKLVVGRDKEENEHLLNLAKENDYLFMPHRIIGPTALGRGIFSDELIKLSCSITSRYCDLNGAVSAEIGYKRIPGKQESILEASPIKEDKLISLRV